jgi:hypothetical protein
MARNIVPCQAWVNHKKGSKWTEEEVLLGLQELGIILDQEFEGVVGKHLLKDFLFMVHLF